MKRTRFDRGQGLFFVAVLGILLVGSGGWASADEEGNYLSVHAGGFKTQFDLRSSTAEKVQLTFGTEGCPGRFRVYIPPGATRVTLNFYVPNGSLIGAVTRFQTPPQLSYCGVKASNFSSLPWKGAGTLTAMTDEDYQIRTTGGHFTPINQYLSGSNGLETGGWLYFKVLDVDSTNDVFRFQYIVDVNRAAYVDWYVSRTDADWDSSGDPLPLIGAHGDDLTDPSVWADNCTGKEPVPGTSYNPGGSSGGETGGSTGGGSTGGGSTGGSTGGGTSGTTTGSNCAGLSGIAYFACVLSGAGSTGGNSGGDSGNTGGGETPQAQGEAFMLPLQTHLGAFVSRVVTRAELYAQVQGDLVYLMPTLSFEPPPSDTVEAFAMILVGDQAAFIGRQALAQSIAYVQYYNGDRIYAYKRISIANSGNLTCDAFDFLKETPVSRALLFDAKVSLIFGIAPEGDVARGEFGNLQGVVITFE